MRSPRVRWILACLAVLCGAAAGLGARGVRPFTDTGRTDWHFVPKPAR